MSKIIITESKMNFGEYDESHVFQIEKSEQYKKLNSNGVKTCEFILLRDDVLVFIEAKESCPNYKRAMSGESAEQVEDYKDYISEISTKMRHSLDLYASILLKKQSQESVSAELLENNLAARQIKLVLVVKKAEAEWLAPYIDVFSRELKPEMRMWKVQSFAVINEAKAKELHYVLS